MVVCVLTNLSSDAFVKAQQTSRAAALTENNFYSSQSDVPADKAPMTYIDMMENDFTLDKLSVIPDNIGVKLAMNLVSKETEQTFDVRAYREQLNYDDIVVQAYIAKYRIKDPSTIVIVWDDKHRNIQEAYLGMAINALRAKLPAEHKDIQVVLFIQSDFTLKLVGLKVETVHGLPNDTLLPVASSCTNHVLVGNNLGLLCANLVDSEQINCVYPDPWRAEEAIKLNPRWMGIRHNWGRTKYFDKLYYLNLEKRSDRRIHTEQQLDKLNLSGVRVNAVDGKQIKWQPNYGIQSQYWNSATMGLCLSYRQSLVDAMRNKYENILVLTDDVVLTDDFYTTLEKAWSALPNNWHMLYLSANHGVNVPGDTEKVTEHLYRLKGSVGYHAIIINRVAMPTLLNFLGGPYGPLDVFLSMYQRAFPCYVVYPGVAKQMPGYSDVQEKEVDYEKELEIDYVDHLKVSSRIAAALAAEKKRQEKEKQDKEEREKN